MPASYRLAIFDFDGTLADSFPFFVEVFNQVAAKHRFQPIDVSRVAELRHLSARQMMQRVGLPAWKLPWVARSFTALMRQNAARIALFDQVEAVLQELAARQVRLAIVTANADDNVRRILGTRLTPLIGHLESGMSMFGKAKRLRRILAEVGIAAREAIYIGDQIADLEAARAAGIAFGAVSWGYASIESLQAHRPDRVFAQVADLRDIAVESALGER